MYWHERWQNPDLGYSNLRIQYSEDALSAYGEGMQGAFWLDRPQIAP